MDLSPKKEKSKSKSKSKEVKEKVKEKPPKDTKSKKSKDTQSKKKSEKKSKKDGGQKSKSDINESQSDISFFKPPLFQPVIDDALCQLHKQKNLAFCEICQQPACQSCTIFGPHNNQMHKLSKLDQCYKARYLYLNELVCGGLIQKRQKLMGEIQQMNQQCEQIRYIKYNIQKMTKIEFNETLDRLKNSAGSKFAVLHHEMAELQKDLQSINSLGNQFFQLTNMNPETFTAENNPKGMIPFLLRTKYLQEEAENLISKPLKVNIDIYPYDLPREVTERKVILQKNQINNQIVNFKNEVIWRLVEERKEYSNNLMEQFYDQANLQCQEWTKLNTMLKDQLQSYDMICHFCGVRMNQKSVNGNCDANRSDSPAVTKVFSGFNPGKQNLNNNYHYFVNNQ